VRIHQIEIENFMRLRVVQLTPTGHVVQITGENGSGKSSFLNAIVCALTGKGNLPSVPVRMGQGSARITLNLGEVVVRWTCSPDRDTTLVLESTDGARFPKPQTLLAQLYNAIAFDPTEFVRMDPKARLETLRRLVPIDINVDELDALNERDYRLRTDWNARAKSFAERVKTVQEGVDLAMDVTLTDVSALVAKLASASEHNAAVLRIEHERTQLRFAVEKRRADAALRREQAARLIQEAESLDALAQRDENVLANAPALGAVVDVSELQIQINEAQKENAVREHQARQRELLAVAQRELADAEAQSDLLTAAREARVSQKEAAMARANMPVPGLSFGDGDVLFMGIPFDQASTAEQIRVSMAIAMAANPKLRVVLIRDGSLLDAKSLAIIEQMAEEHDYQVFLECVASNESVGVVFSQGEITSIDGKPVTESSQAVGAGA
jgi:energy-coupling factor transporter ATP-binding protein EcfA2